MRAGDDVAAVGPWRRNAADGPVFDGGYGDVARHRFLERFVEVGGGGQLGIGDSSIGGRVDDGSVFGFERCAFDAPLFSGKLDKDFAGGGGAAAHCGHRGRRRAAAGCGAVVGRRGRVGHDQQDVVGSHFQLFGGGLGQLGAGALANFDLAGHDGDAAVFGDTHARGDEAFVSFAAFARLRLGGGARHGNQQSRAGDAEKTAPAELEVVAWRLAQLVALGLAQLITLRSAHGARVRATRVVFRCREKSWSPSRTSLFGGAGFCFRRAFDGGEDFRVSAAAAQVAVHPLDDLLAAGVGVGFEQARGRENHPRNAIAALHRAFVEKRLLHRPAGGRLVRVPRWCGSPCRRLSQPACGRRSPGGPSSSTVQARHWPSPQPYLVPVSSRSSRSTSSSGRSGSVVTLLGWPLILSVRVTSTGKPP